MVRRRTATCGRIVHVVNALIVRHGACLVTQRGPTMSYTSKWELPGGKVEQGELPREALRRELREELGVEVELGRRIATTETQPGARTFLVDVYEARLVGTPRLEKHSQHRWLGAEALDGLDWTEPHAPLLPAVKERLETLKRLVQSPLDPASIVERSMRLSEATLEWGAASWLATLSIYGILGEVALRTWLSQAATPGD